MTDVYSNGGDTVEVINAAADEGFCLESDLPSDESGIDFSTDPHGRIFDAFKVLEAKSWALPTTIAAAKIIFPFVSDKDIAEVARYKRIKRRILELRSRNCIARRYQPGIKIGFNASASPKVMVALVNRELNRGKVVGIAFHSNVIYAIPDDEDGHVVTVVGRRWNSQRKTRQYLIRDTFGAARDIYKPHIESPPQMKGYIWLDENDLLENIFEVNFLRSHTPHDRGAP